LLRKVQYLLYLAIIGLGLVIGIDLAGSELRNTGFCIMDTNLTIKDCFVIKKDDEIFFNIDKFKPDLIAIDAPLTLPIEGKNFRVCDEEIRKIGIKIFPPLLGPMKRLTKRGIRIRKGLERKGYKVIEVYPGAAQDILGIPRKKKGLGKLREGLRKLGIRNLPKFASSDELDAVTCALVGALFLKGRCEEVGIEMNNDYEGKIVIPTSKIRLRK
jgi:hypothetical protein